MPKSLNLNRKTFNLKLQFNSIQSSIQRHPVMTESKLETNATVGQKWQLELANATELKLHHDMAIIGTIV